MRPDPLARPTGRGRNPNAAAAAGQAIPLASSRTNSPCRARMRAWHQRRPLSRAAPFHSTATGPGGSRKTTTGSVLRPRIAPRSRAGSSPGSRTDVFIEDITAMDRADFAAALMNHKTISGIHGTRPAAFTSPLITSAGVIRTSYFMISLMSLTYSTVAPRPACSTAFFTSSHSFLQRAHQAPRTRISMDSFVSRW